MKQKKASLSFGDVFNDPKPSIMLSKDEKGYEIGPHGVSEAILSIFGIKKTPRFIKFENVREIDRVLLLYLGGIDQKRYLSSFDTLDSFQKLKINGFPTTVIARIKNNKIISPEQSLLGYSISPKEKKVFATLDEMCLSEHKLIDNGFPMKKSETNDMTNNKHRYEYFGGKRLTEEDLLSYRALPEKVEGTLNAVAIDCEMIETSMGDELSRLSVIGYDEKVLLDEYYKPHGEIVDLRTSISGIVMENIANATKYPENAIDSLSVFADQHTIIIGHSLENDMKALKLLHTKIIDTSIIYNNEPNIYYPKKPGLGFLYQKYFGLNIREKGCSHDSIEDAVTSLKLAKLSMNEAVSLINTAPIVPEMLSSFIATGKKVDVISNSKISTYHELNPEMIRCKLIDDDEARLSALIETLPETDSSFMFCHFNTLETCNLEDDESKAIGFYNTIIEKVLPLVPKDTALFVYSGCGNKKRINDLRDNRSKAIEMNNVKQGLLWAFCP